MQTSIFNVQSLEDKISEAISLLESNGYRVIKIEDKNIYKIKNVKDLVEFFYSRLQFYNKGRRIHYNVGSETYKNEMKLAKGFIKSRSTNKKETKATLIECAEIIDCVLKYEDLFSLSEPIHSFSIFGQDELKWITDRAISILNRENSEANEAELAFLLEAFDKQYEEEAVKEAPQQTIVLEKILGGFEDGGKGKKK